MFKKIVVGSILVSSITGLSSTYASAASIDHTPKKVTAFAAQSDIILEEEETLTENFILIIMEVKMAKSEFLLRIQEAIHLNSKL